MAQFKVPSQPKMYQTRYARFRGVDFSTDPALVDPSRSPFAPNLVSDAGGMPEKRPGWRTLFQLNRPINGIFEWEMAGEPYLVIHGGDTIYTWKQVEGESPRIIWQGLNSARSQGFAMDGAFYLLTGKELMRLRENKEEGPLPWCERVKEHAYVPLTSIGRSPQGAGTDYEACNMLTKRRRNSFCCDGSARDYYLDGEVSNTRTVTCTLDGEEITGFTVDTSRKFIRFDTAPPKPQVAGRDNLEIAFDVTDQASIIEECTICSVFAGCAFLSGNPEKRSFDYRSGYGDPTYFPDLGYTRVGSDTPIMGYCAIGSYQAIVKAPSQQEATVYLRQESLLDGKTIYPVRQGVSGVGAVSPYAFATLLDEPLFLSPQGVFGLCTSSVSEEKAVQNRSYFIDSALKGENGLENASATVWRGLYVLALGNRCYLLDGGQEKSWRSQSMGDYVYECYHWENIPARCIAARGEDLFFGTEDGRLCRFSTDVPGMERYSDDGAAIPCAWSTKADDDGSFTQYKTMMRRGSGIMIKPYLRSSVKVNIRTEKDLGRDLSYSTMDIWSWEELDFSRMDFTENDAPRVVPFGSRVGRYLTLQITVKNDGLNEGFGVYGIVKRFTKEGNVK